VVITSLNGKYILPSCLDSLRQQTCSGAETILMDNGSTDGSAEYVKRNYPWVRVIRTEQDLGFSGGCNLRAAHATGKYLLFLSNDTVVTPEFLDKLAAEMEKHPQTGVAQSKMLSLDHPSHVDSIGAYFTRTGILFNPQRGDVDKSSPDSAYEVFSAQGACMMVRAGLFKELGGFDEDFVIYFDDTDLCWRSWLAGYKVKLAPHWLIYHKGGETTSSEIPSVVVYHTFNNRLCSLLKNLALRDMWGIIPLHLIICFIGCLLFFARLKPKNDLAILRAIGWNLVKLPRTMSRRRELAGKAVIRRGDLFPRLERQMPLGHLVRHGLSYSSES